jgi:hypothetical protein
MMSIDEQIVVQGYEGKTAVSPTYWWRQRPPCQAATPKPGDPCPSCGAGKLAYDSLFLLTCLTCGQCAESGAFT